MFCIPFCCMFLCPIFQKGNSLHVSAFDSAHSFKRCALSVPRLKVQPLPIYSASLANMPLIEESSL